MTGVYNDALFKSSRPVMKGGASSTMWHEEGGASPVWKESHEPESGNPGGRRVREEQGGAVVEDTGDTVLAQVAESTERERC